MFCIILLFLFIQPHAVNVHCGMQSTYRNARTHIRIITHTHTYIHTRIPSCNGARTYVRIHTHEHTVCIYHTLLRALLRQRLLCVITKSSH